MFGHGIDGYQIHPTRHYYAGTVDKGYLRGSEYGKCYPNSDAGHAAMLASGHAAPYRPLRESGLVYAGALRRSHRKAIACGTATADAFFKRLLDAREIFGQLTNPKLSLSAFKKTMELNVSCQKRFIEASRRLRQPAGIPVKPVKRRRSRWACRPNDILQFLTPGACTTGLGTPAATGKT